MLKKGMMENGYAKRQEVRRPPTIISIGVGTDIATDISMMAYTNLLLVIIQKILYILSLKDDCGGKI